MRKLPLFFLVCSTPLLGGVLAGTRHPNPDACYQLQAGLDGAADLAWVNNTTKAVQLRQAYDTVRFYADLLAASLRAGASVETTKQTEKDMIIAGREFRAKAAALGVEIPGSTLDQFLQHSQICDQPYLEAAGAVASVPLP